MFHPPKVRRKSDTGKRISPNTRQPIQRAVGFEVEVKNWKTYRTRPKGHPVMPWHIEREFTKGRYKHHTKDLLFKGRDYELTADCPFAGNSVPEFITIPFEEDFDGLHRANKAFAQIGELVDRMHHEAKIHPETLNRLDEYHAHGSVEAPTAMIDALPKPDFHPQANVGLRLTAVTDLFGLSSEKPITTPVAERLTRIKSLRGQPQRRERRSMAQAREKAERALDKFRYVFTIHEDWTPSEELLNLLAYMLHYIECPMINYHEYPKSFFPIMARTDFFMMYRLLPFEEQDYFSENDGNMFVKLFEMIKHSLPDIGELELDEEFFEEGIRNDQEADNYRLDGLTRKEWIRGVATGKDLLTSRNFPDQNINRELQTMGSWQKYDDLEAGGRAMPILELRRLQFTDNTEDLRAMAVEIFRTIIHLNEKHQPED
ncbi:hypothetical protein FUAX_39790 (plasmid) [Fulvitalea axinellae]|uniref:Uncharacterized protein n=1 Tax=Fulvitalea axinellae TaxID=1182444 RepID=A0AAU9CU96_9BACT|nr:hypothetical protein FUAX_39790 [Fulvitalea axinellae]